MNFKFPRAIPVLKKRQFKSIGLALFVVCLSSPVAAQVAVDVHNQSIRQVLKRIERSVGCQFFYNDALSSLDKKVTLQLTGQPLETVLDRLFAGTDITYKRRNKTTMRVRGVTSLNDDSNDALILVDGIEQRLEDLNPADIENVSILKDASATSIYGSRAANGVILVTTKRGKSGKVQVNYTYYYGFQKAMNNPKHMDTETYMRQQIVAYQNAGKTGDQIPYDEAYI